MNDSFSSGRIVLVILCAMAFNLTGAVEFANAQSGPPERSSYCILVGMLGGTPPPQCRQGGDEADQDEAIDQLRLATVAFHSIDVAAAAGWNAEISECVESPAGGMGYHIANIDQLADGGQLRLLQPEVLLYVPTADGSMAFLGVEYIIPAEDWPHEEAPEFLGQELQFNPMLDIWALHVWSARPNPDGLFADFNPDVDCAFAGD